MKSLRDYKINLTETHGVETPSWGSPFTPAIHGTVNGLPVRGILPGNLPGASPVLLCSDATGFLTEVKREDFVNIDPAYLPLKIDLAATAASTR